MRTHFSVDYDYAAFKTLVDAIGVPSFGFHVLNGGGTNVDRAYAEVGHYSVALGTQASPVAVGTFVADYPNSIALPLTGLGITPVV